MEERQGEPRAWQRWLCFRNLEAQHVADGLLGDRVGGWLPVWLSGWLAGGGAPAGGMRTSGQLPVNLGALCCQTAMPALSPKRPDSTRWDGVRPGSLSLPAPWVAPVQHGAKSLGPPKTCARLWHLARPPSSPHAMAMAVDVWIQRAPHTRGDGCGCVDPHTQTCVAPMAPHAQTPRARAYHR
eukprot:362004-Chlamydomonas_euryale.AAC.12